VKGIVNLGAFKLHNELAWRGNEYYKDIQAAIDAASPGETINVDGRVQIERQYTEALNTSKNLNIVGESSLAFDGINDVVKFENASLNFQDSFSISLWVKFITITVNKNEYVVTGGGTDNPSGGKYRLVLPANNSKMQSMIQTPGSWGGFTVNSINNIQTGIFYNMVCVWDKSGNTWKFYIDNVLQGTVNTAGLTALNNNGRLNIGALTESYYWSNTIVKDLRAYSRALGTSEITNIYNGISISDDGLVGHWPFNGGSNSNIKDRSKINNSYVTFGSPIWVPETIRRPKLTGGAGTAINITDANVNISGMNINNSAIGIKATPNSDVTLDACTLQNNTKGLEVKL